MYFYLNLVIKQIFYFTKIVCLQSTRLPATYRWHHPHSQDCQILWSFSESKYCDPPNIFSFKISNRNSRTTCFWNHQVYKPCKLGILVLSEWKLILGWIKMYSFPIISSFKTESNVELLTAQRMKFSIKDFFIKCDQTRSLLQIWSHLLKKSLMENFVFCAVTIILR